MVLSTNNIHSHPSENTPPQGSKHARSLAARLRNTIHDASRRRRARATTSGAPHSPRVSVEHAHAHAHRRSTTRSPTGSDRVTVILPRVPTPTPSPSPDVDMQDVTSVSIPVSPVSLPRQLARPPYREVSKDVMATIALELADIEIEYLREGLAELGPGLLKVLASTQTRSPSLALANTLPKELAVIVHDRSLDAPTHMLAVYSHQHPTTSASAGGVKRRVTLFPAHNIVFAAHCANLPVLPASSHPSALSPLTDMGALNLTLPVIPLCIPSPETFPHLSAYLYTTRADHLLTALLPCSPPSAILACVESYAHSPDESDDDSENENDDAIDSLAHFGSHLARTYTPVALLQHALRVNGVWRNVCALGIADARLWGALDVAWEVLLRGLGAQ